MRGITILTLSHFSDSSFVREPDGFIRSMNHFMNFFLLTELTQHHPTVNETFDTQKKKKLFQNYPFVYVFTLFYFQSFFSHLFTSNKNIGPDRRETTGLVWKIIL